MASDKLTGRVLKQKVFGLLKSADTELLLKELVRQPLRLVINPLFSFLHHPDPYIKWGAVTAMGMVVAEMAERDMEAARIMMRRIMWNLNDESGGIGWGSPEAMGEILARHKGLAQEYAHVLISYTMVEGNYLEDTMLQRGLLWGLGRLAQESPDLLRHAVPHLLRYLESGDATVRGLAARIAGVMGMTEAVPGLEALVHDLSEIELYIHGQLIHRRVCGLSLEALSEIKRRLVTPLAANHPPKPDRRMP